MLEGVRLPAARRDLVAYASAQDREAGSQLMQIADREYGYLDEVGEQLARTQPAPPAQQPLPRPESGQPPDEAQSETLKTQTASQES